MNKRITYLLATLLIAESALPLSAQSLEGQTRTYSAINTNHLRTIAGGTTIASRATTGPAINIPTTTGPAITVKLDKIYATEIADARAKVIFQLHNVELKKIYTEQASSLHIALDSNMKLTSITSTGEATNDLIETPGVVAIYDSKNFTFEFTAKNINPDSIKGNSYFTFKIPGYLLTTNVDLEVKVFIEHDTVSQPKMSVDSTASSGAKIVTLDCDTKYSRIRYTLDGSDVTLTSPLYDGTPITIDSSNTLKATAFVGTMPSEQIVVEYHNIPSNENSNSNGNTNSGGENSSPDSGSSNSSGNSNSDSESSNSSGNSSSDSESSNSGGNSSLGSGSSNSGGNSSLGSGSSNSGGNSNSDKDNDHLVEIDSSTDTNVSTSTTEDSDQPTLDITSTPTVSNTVTTLIEQKERNLTTQATEVQYGLTINNQKIELANKLLVSNGRTLAPLRTIAEALNIPIHYHAESKTAIIKTEDKLIEFPLGYNVAIVNGEMIQIDTNDSTVMSTIQEGRTYLPLKFIAEQLNLNIHFDGEQVHMRSVK